MQWINRRAASMGPRSDERGRDRGQFASIQDAPASMGPRSDERGRPGGPDVGEELIIASMGPRSDERGRFASRRRCRGITQLQWGRVRMNAEGPNFWIHSPLCHGFNGAAFG